MIRCSRDLLLPFVWLQAQYLRLLEALLSLIRGVGVHQGTLTAQPVNKAVCHGNADTVKTRL